MEQPFEAGPPTAAGPVPEGGDGPAPADVDELYGLPLEEFTAARNALAKQLARRGDRAAAAEVKRLPKPTRAAWALNQVARRQRSAVAELLEAARLRDAQHRALAGDAGRLREATRAAQDQVSRLVQAALAVLGGPGGPVEERLRRTLHAAATDVEIGALLTQGRLVSEVDASGFGLEGLSHLPAPDPPLRAQEQDGAEERARLHARREAEREVERLRAAAARARERARRLVEQAEGAERRARAAREEADTALAAAAEAQRLADEAAR